MMTTTELDAKITELEQQRAALETEAQTLALQIASGEEKRETAFTRVLARLQAIPQQIAALKEQRQAADSDETAAAYEALTVEMHGAYTELAKLDAQIREHQDAIAALNQQRQTYLEKVQVTFGRRQRVYSRVIELGLKSLTNDMARKYRVDGYM